SPIRHRILRPDGRAPDKMSPRQWGRAYVAGNVVEGNVKVTRDNWMGGVQIDNDDPAQILPRVRADKPFPMASVPLQSATEAFVAVLNGAGAMRPKRDEVDRRIIDQVRTGNMPEKAPLGIITDIKQVGGYPVYQGEPYKDSDGDGIPDEWERKYGL